MKWIKAEMIQFQISAIHAFCSRILREYAAGTDVGFNVIEPFERRQLLNEVVRPELAAIANVPPTSTNRQDLVLLLRHFGRSKLESMLSQFFGQKIFYAVSTSVILPSGTTRSSTSGKRALTGRFASRSIFPNFWMH